MNNTQAPSFSLSLLAKIATGRSGGSDQEQPFKEAGLLVDAKDGWTDITDRGRKLLLSNGYRFDAKSGWILADEVALLKSASQESLLAEINRRGLLQPLYGAIGAMHDHLDRTGALDEKLTQYLAYRVRREEAAVTGAPDSAARVANWQECIDELDQEGGPASHSAVEGSPR